MDPIVKTYVVPEEETSRVSYHVAVSSTDRLTDRGILKCLIDLLGKWQEILTIYLKDDEWHIHVRTKEIKTKILETESHTHMGITYSFHKRFAKVITLTVYDFPVSYSDNYFVEIMTDIGYVRTFKDQRLPTTNVHKRIREVELEIPNKKLKDIPQLIVLKADYGDAKVRVVTPGQPSPCFRCEKFGHSRKECPLRAPEKEKKRQPVPAVAPAVPVPTTVKSSVNQPVPPAQSTVQEVKKTVVKTVTQSPPAEPKAPKRRREDGARKTSETAEFEFTKPRPPPIKINESSIDICEYSYHPSTSTPHDTSASSNNFSICSIHGIPTTPTWFE
ncbi:hypothetical protein SNE40_019199 [Patella caerulea]|uniref:CCHC-type domain-containing protein n=1 Tax=Patella caerulea TaxID=87958 RepID=A0AAN8J9Z9_PATCE